MKKTTTKTEYMTPQVDMYLTDPAEMLCTSTGVENPDITEEEYIM